MLQDTFDRYVQDSRTKRGTGQVDVEFLKEIEGWREALARNLLTTMDHGRWTTKGTKAKRETSETGREKCGRGDGPEVQRTAARATPT